MRRFFYLLLLLSGSPAFAQAQVMAAPATPQVAAPDTVAALHRLFAGHRQRRNIIAGSLGLGLVAGTVGSLATAETAPTNPRNILDLDSAPGGSSGAGSSPSSAAPATSGWLVAAVVAGPLLALDYVAYASYTRKREDKAVAAYQAGKLSPKLKKKLKAKYFRPLPVR